MDKGDSLMLSLAEEDEGAGWIVTYADLVTLLLVFFILMFAISTINLEKFKYAIKSIQESLGEGDAKVELLEVITGPESKGKKIKLERVIGIVSSEQEILEEVSRFVESEELSDNIVVRISGGKIYIRIKGKVLFQSGATELNVGANPILEKIADIIEENPEYLTNIKGFTDNIPIKTEKFPSNWELSAYRATTVLKYFIRRGIDPIRLTATGYGSLMPLVPNNSEENRGINRRVEFVLEKEKEIF